MIDEYVVTDADQRLCDAAGISGHGVDFSQMPRELAERLLVTIREYVGDDRRREIIAQINAITSDVDRWATGAKAEQTRKLLARLKASLDDLEFVERVNRDNTRHDNTRQTPACELIATERKRQVDVYGYDAAHDDVHRDGELADAAASYALSYPMPPPGVSAELNRQRRHAMRQRVDNPPVSWPFDSEFWDPRPGDRIRELVKAGALIVAEIERLQRKEGDA